MAYIGQDIADVAVTVGQGVIDASHIADSSITTADLGNDAVTPNKLDDDGTGFQMGSLGLGTAVSGSHKLTVGGTATFSGNITGNLVGNVTGNVTGDITGNLTGNVTGNVSGSAATVTGATQSNITSVGTLSSLTVSGTVRIPHDTTDSFRIGASDDLELWHNGTDSAVTNANTGKLYLWNYANGDTVIGSNNAESAVFTGANTTLRGTLNVAGTSTFTGLTHLKGSAWNNILKLGNTSRSEQLTHINNGTVNFSIYTSNGTKGVITANHDGSAMTLGADYGSGTLTVTPPTTFTGRVTLSNDGSDNGIFMGGGWQIFDNASEAHGTTGDLIFYHGASRIRMADDGGFKIKQGSAGAIAKAFSLENAGDTNLAAAIFEESTNPTSGELRLYSGGSEKVYLRANSSSSNAFLFKGGQMQDITANNTGIQYRANWDTGFLNRIDNNFDGASADSSYMRFKIASGAGSQNTALTLYGDGDVTVHNTFAVTANHSNDWGTELFNASSTGHGAKIRGGSTSSHYAMYVSNYDQTQVVLSCLADGHITAGSIMSSPNFRTGRNTTSVANTTWTQLSGLTNLSPGLYTIHAYIADYQATQWSVHGVVEATGHNTMHGIFQNHSTMELRTNNKDIELWHSAGGTFTIQVSWTKQA